MSFFYGREMLLLHTAFWTARHEGAEALLKAIEPLGVAGLSLDDAISPTLWKELRGALQGGQFVPLVIHNPLPAPPWLPRERDFRDDLLLASPDREKRERAVAVTLRTVELAHELGVRTVVLHLGRVGMPSPWGELKARFEREVLPGTDEGVEFLEKLRDERAGWGGEEMDAACFSLDRLLPTAERMGVKLALESRFSLEAFPSYREALHLFERFSGAPLGWWHNAGHAAVHAALGLIRHGRALESFKPWLMGGQLHDVKGLEDHLPPGAGDFDFQWLRSQVPESLFWAADIRRVEEPSILPGQLAELASVGF